MPDSDDLQVPPEQEQLHGILMKIVAYQHSLAGGRAVELDELRRQGVLATADIEFLTAQGVSRRARAEQEAVPSSPPGPRTRASSCQPPRNWAALPEAQG